MTPETTKPAVVIDPNEPMIALHAPDYVSDWVFFVERAGVLSDDLGGGQNVLGAKLHAYHLRCSPTTSCAWYEPFCERVEPRSVCRLLSVYRKTEACEYQPVHAKTLLLPEEQPKPAAALAEEPSSPAPKDDPDALYAVVCSTRSELQSKYWLGGTSWCGADGFGVLLMTQRVALGVCVYMTRTTLDTNVKYEARRYL